MSDEEIEYIQVSFIDWCVLSVFTQHLAYISTPSSKFQTWYYTAILAKRVL